MRYDFASLSLCAYVPWPVDRLGGQCTLSFLAIGWFRPDFWITRCNALAVGLHVSSKLRRELSERWARGSESGWFFSRPRDYYRAHAKKEVERERERECNGLGYCCCFCAFWLEPSKASLHTPDLHLAPSRSRFT